MDAGQIQADEFYQLFITEKLNDDLILTEESYDNLNIQKLDKSSDVLNQENILQIHEFNDPVLYTLV